jgi:hypothetical protein
MMETLQTLGICVGAIALVVIAYSTFLVAHTIVMAMEEDDVEVVDESQITAELMRQLDKTPRRRSGGR